MKQNVGNQTCELLIAQYSMAVPNRSDTRSAQSSDMWPNGIQGCASSRDEQRKPQNHVKIKI